MPEHITSDRSRDYSRLYVHCVGSWISLLSMLNALSAAKLIGDKPAELCDSTVLDLNLFSLFDLYCDFYYWFKSRCDFYYWFKSRFKSMI